jgi:hypothetical protein
MRSGDFGNTKGTQGLGGILRLAWLTLASALLAGCSVCQMGTLKLADHVMRGPVYSITHLPYGADRTSVQFYELVADPVDSPPFLVIFPDGFRANIRDIDRGIIEAHLGPVEREQPDRGLRAVYQRLDEHGLFTMHAYLSDGGQLSSLSLRASGATASKVLATADGAHAFGFPLTEADFRTLLNVPVRVGWEPVGTIYGECGN